MSPGNPERKPGSIFENGIFDDSEKYVVEYCESVEFK